MPPSLLRLVLVSAACAASGCAVMNSRPPSKDYKPSAPPRCSTATGSVAADVIFGSLAAAIGIGAMADGSSAGAIGLLTGAAFIGSAAAGISWGNKCGKRHKEHALWLSRREDRIEERAALRRRARRLRARQAKEAREQRAEDEKPRSPYGSANRPGDTPPLSPNARQRKPEKPASTTHQRSWPQGDWSEFWRQVNP